MALAMPFLQIALHASWAQQQIRNFLLDGFHLHLGEQHLCDWACARRLLLYGVDDFVYGQVGHDFWHDDLQTTRLCRARPHIELGGRFEENSSKVSLLFVQGHPPTPLSTLLREQQVCGQVRSILFLDEFKCRSPKCRLLLRIHFLRVAQLFPDGMDCDGFDPCNRLRNRTLHLFVVVCWLQHRSLPQLHLLLRHDRLLWIHGAKYVPPVDPVCKFLQKWNNLWTLCQEEPQFEDLLQRWQFRLGRTDRCADRRVRSRWETSRQICCPTQGKIGMLGQLRLNVLQQEDHPSEEADEADHSRDGVWTFIPNRQRYGIRNCLKQVSSRWRSNHPLINWVQ